MSRRPFPVLLLLVSSMALAGLADAQDSRPRLGVGFNAMLNTTDGLGVGIHARAARAVNADLSIAAEAGFTGFVLEGRDEATYLFTPQASVIVTLDERGSRTPYFLGGFGASIPLTDDDTSEAGPTMHFGFGWVQGLRDTVLFYEVDPTLVVGSTEVSFMIPLRIGVIF